MITETDDMRPADDYETGEHLSGHRLIPGAVETEHGLMVPVTGPTVMVIEVHYLESDVHDGDRPTDDTRLQVYVLDGDDPAIEAVRLIEQYGLSFAATGTDWAANPDGSYTANYATGEQVETTAHLYGFNLTEAGYIMATVR